MGRVCVPWLRRGGSRWLGGFVAVTCVMWLCRGGQCKGFFVLHGAVVAVWCGRTWPQWLGAAGCSEEGGGGEGWGRVASCQSCLWLGPWELRPLLAPLLDSAGVPGVKSHPCVTPGLNPVPGLRGAAPECRLCPLIPLCNSCHLWAFSLSPGTKHSEGGDGDGVP